MSLFFKAFLCAFIAVIVLFCHEYLQRLRKQMFSRPERTVFAIGILSGRENFEQREAGRSTWLKRYSSIESDVKAWFIVGNTSCEIPHEYRFNMYSCEKWNVNISGLQDKFYTAGQVQTLNCPPDSERRFFQGFSFQVNYPVVVTKLGILSSLLLQNSEVKIAIMDVQSKEILIQSLISTNESRASNGYIYADVGTILYFPKNYEGLVVVEGYLKDTACSDIGWNDGGGIITFKRVYPTPEHLDSKKYSSRLNVASSLGFFVPEMKSLKKLLYEEEFKTKQWYLHLEEINKRLRSEIAKNQDILIVDVIDTYRSLPVKLLKFYEW